VSVIVLKIYCSILVQCVNIISRKCYLPYIWMNLGRMIKNGWLRLFATVSSLKTTSEDPDPIVSRCRSGSLTVGIAPKRRCDSLMVAIAPGCRCDSLMVGIAPGYRCDSPTVSIASGCRCGGPRGRYCCSRTSRSGGIVRSTLTAELVGVVLPSRYRPRYRLPLGPSVVCNTTPPH
jgi:hypothetical protein